jgi:hypothetical protein
MSAWKKPLKQSDNLPPDPPPLFRDIFYHLLAYLLVVAVFFLLVRIRRG